MGFFDKKNKKKQNKQSNKKDNIQKSNLGLEFDSNNVDFDKLEKDFNKNTNLLNNELSLFNNIETEKEPEDFKVDKKEVFERLNFEKDPKKFREKEFKNVKKVLKKADTQINEEISKQTKIDCKAGCSVCCNQLVNIFPIEETRLLNHIENKMLSSVKTQVKHNTIKWMEFFNENTPDKKLLEIEDLNELNKKLGINKIPCPFLIDHKCSIYEDRPLSCRSHIIDDVKKCEENVLIPSLIQNEKNEIFNEVAKENVIFLMKFKQKPYITRPLVLTFLDLLGLKELDKKNIDYKLDKNK